MDIGGNDAPFKAAMIKGDNAMKGNRFKDAVDAYGDALNYKPSNKIAKIKQDDAQSKLDAEIEAAKPKKPINPLSQKYPQGVTEEMEKDKGVFVTKRIVVKGTDAWVYIMKKFTWGGIVFYKDNDKITQSEWDSETK